MSNAKTPEWKIDCLDCIDAADTLEDGSVDCFFLDSPYNQGIDYGQGPSRDTLPDNVFLNWCRLWIMAAVRKLSNRGSIFLVISDEYAGDFDVLAHRKLGLNRRNWIKWYETFGQATKTKFGRTSRHILYYTKSEKDFLFNPESILIPSARQTVYKDKRANVLGKPLDDVWDVPRVCGTFGERVVGVPTQIPLEIARRCILPVTEPGSLVVDLFCGSGTAAVASVLNGRRFYGSDRNPDYVKISRERVVSELAKAKD